MKLFVASILLLISIAGTFVPCCLTDNCTAEQNISPGNDQRLDGTCSPFFACSTCPGFVKLTRAIQVAEPSTPLLVHHEKIIAYSSFSPIASLLQPPRFC